MMNQKQNYKIETWGGLECTINRVNEIYYNQLDYFGHDKRPGDISLIAELGIKKMRYPILWEKHQPHQFEPIDWSLTEKQLTELCENNIDVIAGLVHHGSGPKYVHMLADSFAQGLAAYAAEVAKKFPWINYYTPINEPLTTARFCGLYGIWFPHLKDDHSFCRILINECKGTVLAMQAIRSIIPVSKLVQTDDLGKTHSTPQLKYQADFENHRRWLSYDVLCGKVNEEHPLWNYLLNSGIYIDELEFFMNNVCEPDIMGFNHYLTSERYLDENIDNYPSHTHGSNSHYRYADIEAVRVGHVCPDGPYNLLKEAWDRFRLPIAVTEVHLFCTREEQMRWFNYIWEAAHKLQKDGVDIRAITPWAMFGSFGWNKLLTHFKGDYEPGVFNFWNGRPRPTILAKMVKAFSSNTPFIHPILNSKGWWQRDKRVIYGEEAYYKTDETLLKNQPLLIIGKTGTLGQAFARVCELRGITYCFTGREEIDITNPESIEIAILKHNPWAIVNTAGFVHVDQAENQPGSCFAVNTYGPGYLAALCSKNDIQLLTYSSDLVFDGRKTSPYTEKDELAPINFYGRSKALGEENVLNHYPKALIIRTSAFFGPWDQHNFIWQVVDSLQSGKIFYAVNDVVISPSYIPDLVNTSLDLLLDQETGIWHLSNDGQISWSDLAFTVAERSGLNTGLIKSKPLRDFRFNAQRPAYSVLNSERGLMLPSLDKAIDRCLGAFEH